MVALGAAVVSFGGLAARPAHAEVIELLDKTKLNAKIIHFYDGVFTVEVAGQTQKVPREKIRSIGFSLPPSRPEFSGQANDAVKKMQKEIEGTKFQIKGASTKGDSATLKVARQKGDDSETGEIAFVRENGEWKMLPPAQ